MFSFPWFMGNCYAKMGLTDQAETIFKNELRDSSPVDYQIRLMINLALLSAAKGVKEEAEDRMNKAIDLAVAYGEQNLLLKVSAAAGYALHSMGDNVGAAEAYQQAMDLAASLSQEDETLNSAYLFEMYVGCLMVLGYDEELLVKTIQLLPGALDDLESWWHLSALAPFVVRFTDSPSGVIQNTGVAESLKTFNRVMAERTDYSLSAMR